MTKKKKSPIKSYELKNGEKRYMFQIYLGTDPVTGKPKRTTRRGFTSTKEAKLALARLKIDVDENGFKTPTKMRFREVYKLWLENYRHTVKLSTVMTTTEYFSSAILPKFGDLYTDKITVPFCQKVVNEWSKHYVNFSAYRNYVKVVLDHAITLEVIENNPMTKIVLPKPIQEVEKEDIPVSYYNKKQLEHFLELLQDNETTKDLVLFRLLAFTGARKGEVLALTWVDINFKDKTVRLNKTIARVEGSLRHIQAPKTSTSNRVISLDDKTLAILEKWRKVQARLLLAFGINATFNKTQPIIASTDKRAMNQHHVATYPNDRLVSLILKYNLPPITPHGFRHTHASLLFESGAEPKEVQERLGHKNLSTTMDIYTHVTQKVKDNTATKFANYVNF